MRSSVAVARRRKRGPAPLASRSYHQILRKVYADPKYSGRHLVIVGRKIYAARTGREANRLLHRVMKERPKEAPLLVDVPGADTLLGPWTRAIPIGFLTHDRVPPLLGRMGWTGQDSARLKAKLRG